MSVCCEFAKHLWALLVHHSGHRPKISQESLAALTLYPPHRRRVKAQPQDKESK